MRLYAFEGIHYTPQAGEAGELAAPPYDQLNDALRDRYHAQSPHHFVHLSKPVAPEGGDPYSFAAALHRKWLREGVIARDPRPAIYPYVIELAGGDEHGGERLGVLGLVRYEDPTVIRPHEQTLDKPLADRTALLEAMQVDLEPVLLLSEDHGQLDALLREDLQGQQPLVRHRDADGHVHAIYRIDDPGRIERYRDVLNVPSAIADGHHRYKVGQRFAAEHRAAPDTAAAAKLAVVTSLDSPALTIDPIHRAFKTPVDVTRLAGVPSAVEPFAGDSGREFAAAVAAAAQPALGVWVVGRAPEVWRFDSPRLAVEIFQDTILPALSLPPEASTDGTVVYRSDPSELWSQVAAGDLGTGVWLPPMEPATFAAAIADGQMLPAKSTRFLPKVMSGLVWADHDSKLL
ncbi:MAG TPA: DUF1015 domain-containing protein [Thermoanaerobaculia bacterium]|jgi:uncharacterized protein (DUF1015 family)|nr:DUF1015 domain-containing protein [Thermoanaerobaculia bacterium]